MRLYSRHRGAIPLEIRPFRFQYEKQSVRSSFNCRGEPTMLAALDLPCAALYFREGGSDKEYHARIEAKEDGFVVNFAYGKRGAALSTGTKTSSPTTLENATKIYE